MKSLISLTATSDNWTATVKITNTGKEPLSSAEYTVVFLDEKGKIQATKKVSLNLSKPLSVSDSTYQTVSCDYKEAITDVTFQK